MRDSLPVSVIRDSAGSSSPPAASMKETPVRNLTLALILNLLAAPVPAGNGYFYLVTARNRLWEEGTKGSSSAGAQRANPAPCP